MVCLWLDIAWSSSPGLKQTASLALGHASKLSSQRPSTVSKLQRLLGSQENPAPFFGSDKAQKPKDHEPLEKE